MTATNIRNLIERLSASDGKNYGTRQALLERSFNELRCLDIFWIC